jgi:acetyltransferase-like isoleucine patch superfamily enzyme
MLNKILRAISRVFFHLSRMMLRFIEAVSPRRYMPIYQTLLAKYGITFIGVPRYIASKVRFDDFSLVTLGDRIVISESVALLTHDYSLTTGLISINKCPTTDQAFLKPINIWNNVFIGLGSIILPGANIGNNVIVGAGSVVRGKIPDDSIVIGNPATVICKLTDKSKIWFEKMDSSSLRVDK